MRAAEGMFAEARQRARRVDDVTYLHADVVVHAAPNAVVVAAKIRWCRRCSAGGVANCRSFNRTAALPARPRLPCLSASGNGAWGTPACAGQVSCHVVVGVKCAVPTWCAW